MAPPPAAPPTGRQAPARARPFASFALLVVALAFTLGLTQKNVLKAATISELYENTDAVKYVNAAIESVYEAAALDFMGADAEEAPADPEPSMTDLEAAIDGATDAEAQAAEAEAEEEEGGDDAADEPDASSDEAAESDNGAPAARRIGAPSARKGAGTPKKAQPTAKKPAAGSPAKARGASAPPTTGKAKSANAPKAASKDGGGGGGGALVEVEADKHCGVSLRQEPQVRAITENNHKCKCTAATCAELDSPTISYVVHAHVALAPSAMQAALRKAYGAISANIDMNRGPAFETIVSVPAPARSVVAKATFQAFLKAAATVEGKAAASSWEAAMARSSLVFRDATSVAGRRDEVALRASLAPLYRAANAPQVAITHVDADGEATLGAAELRSTVLRSYAADDPGCGDEVQFSFAIQYFRRPSLINAIGSALKKLPISGELLVNDDSATELDDWLTVARKGKPWPFYLLVNGNVHEIRGYNRLAKLARGKFIVFMQDDDVPPPTPRWVHHAASLFRKNDVLGILAGFTGTIQGGPLTGKYGVQKDSIKYRSSYQRRPFMFVTLANMGPMIMRRTAFHEIGMFSGNFSCRGEPGIGFDYEVSLRMWYYGFQVGLYDTEFAYAVGQKGSGTRANRGLYRARQTIERRNSRYHKNVYGPGSGGQNFYIRQGLPGTPSAKSTPRSQVRGVGKLVHEANEQLLASPSKF